MTSDAEATENKSNIFQMRTDREFIAQLDELRRADPALPSRAQVLRNLVRAAYEKLEAKQARKDAKR